MRLGLPVAPALSTYSPKVAKQSPLLGCPKILPPAQIAVCKFASCKVTVFPAPFFAFAKPTDQGGQTDVTNFSTSRSDSSDKFIYHDAGTVMGWRSDAKREKEVEKEEEEEEEEKKEEDAKEAGRQCVLWWPIGEKITFCPLTH